MIVCEMKLVSARGREHDQELGTLVVDNVTSMDAFYENPRKGDYRCRMYRKGDLKRHGGSPGRLIRDAKPTRAACVVGHNRLAEPVGNLVAKALKALGYG